MRGRTMKPNLPSRVLVGSVVVAHTPHACASSSSRGGTGLPDGGAPPADAFIAAEVGGGGGTCNLPSPDVTWLPVGTATADKPTTVTSGGSTGTGTAKITCSVHPNGNGFDIDLSVTVAGTPGGNVTISSPAGAGAVTTSGGAGITASFTSGTMGPYSSSNCTLTFTYEGQPVPVSPAVAAGRIWGHIDCPDAVVAGQMTTGPDGGPTTVSCPASADFLFEQCSE